MAKGWWLPAVEMRVINKTNKYKNTKKMHKIWRSKIQNCNLYSWPRAGDCQLWKWEWLTLRNNFGGKHCHRTHFCLTHRQNYTIGHNTVTNNTVKGYKMQQYDKLYKVNRCLARYRPRATTTNRFTNRAPNKPALHGPNWPKMPILGQIWSFLGKKSFFLLEKS